MPPRKTKTTKKTVKKDTSWQLTTIPLHSWVIFWALVLATMALATVCFTTAFRPLVQPEVDEEALAMFQAVKESLEQQVRGLEEELEGIDSGPGGRLLIYGMPGPGQEGDCSLSWATSTAELYIRHVQPIEQLQPPAQLEISVPYSFDWGNQNYALEPVAIIGEAAAVTLFFGPAIASNGCLPVRDTALEITNSTSTPNEARRGAVENFNATDIRTRTINGMTVLSYRMNLETSQNNVWIGFGRTYRYALFSQGWLTDAEAVKIIQSLRVVQ